MNTHLKVLLIRAGALGDTLMLMPAIIQLRSGAGIVVAGRSPGIEFLKPYVDQCIDFEGSGWHRFFVEDHAGARKPRMPDADCVIAFLNDREGMLHDNLKRAYPACPVYLFPPFPPSREKIHIAQYMSRCIGEAGLPIDPVQSMEESRKRPLFHRSALRGERTYIVLHPGSGSARKNYRPGLWLAIAEELRAECRDRAAKMVLLLGPAEENLLSVFRENWNRTDPEILFCPENEHLMSILGRACLFIGHDSGITHLTAMLGIPVIALFKDSSVSLWRPLGPAVHVLRKRDGESDFIREIVEKGRKLLSSGP